MKTAIQQRYFCCKQARETSWGFLFATHNKKRKVWWCDMYLTWSDLFFIGSSDGSYSRVGPAGAGPMVSCRRRTVRIIVGVVALVFLIAVAVPAGKQDIGTKRQSQHHPERQSKKSSLNCKTPNTGGQRHFSHRCFSFWPWYSERQPASS